jgi:hypothetical protein
MWPRSAFADTSTTSKLAPPPEHSSRSAITNFQRVPEQLAPDGPS